MNEKYHGSWLKIDRAKDHIQELNLILKRFLDSDFYRIRVEQDGDGVNFLAIDLDLSKFPSDRCALIIGDALHNLRSALDLFYAATVNRVDEWTSFPISDTREKLIPRLDSALKKQKIGEAFSKYILDTVKPYETGNFYLWLLRHLNDRDKHHLLIPVFQTVVFSNIRLYDDEQRPINPLGYIISVPHSFRFRIDGYDRRQITFTLEQDRHPTAEIFFNFGEPIKNSRVIPTLSSIADVVGHTIKGCDLL